MKFTLEINMDNAAFEDDQYELTRILHGIASKAQWDNMGHANGEGDELIRDRNGARVGSYKVEEDED